MANPNIVNVTSIFGKSTTLALTTTVGTVLLANASSSGKVFKINTILASNVDGTNDGAVTIAFNTDAGGTGTSTELASTITVPADASLVVVGKENGFYLEENRSIVGNANAASTIEVLISYEDIS
jgi:hypothetical protein